MVSAFSILIGLWVSQIVTSLIFVAEVPDQYSNLYFSYPIFLITLTCGVSGILMISTTRILNFFIVHKRGERSDG